MQRNNKKHDKPNSNSTTLGLLSHHTSYLGARSRRLSLQGRAASPQPSFRIPCGKSMNETILASRITSWVYSFLYSYCRYIPLTCILALLALLVGLSNPSSSKTNNAYANDNTSLLADGDTPSASLTIANPELSGYGKVGELVTVSSNVTVVGNLINSYSLQISGTNSNTTLEGPSSINPINNTTNPNGVSGNNMPNDTWGYSWNGSNYKGIPTSTNPITIDNTGINSTTGSINYTKPLTFAVKFSQDAIAGHYSTKVNLLLTATPRVLTTYTLTLNNNATSGITNTGTSSKTCTTYTGSCTISLSDVVTPTRTGYDFLGWADSNTATSATYTKASTITMSASSTTNNSKTIWAVWKWNWDGKTLNQGFPTITTMQEMTTDICDAAKHGDYKDLKDIRDNKIYRIVKFRDNRCWMTENLRIAGWTITSNDSNVSDSYTVPSSSIFGFSATNTATQAVYLSGSNGFYSWCAATAGSCSDLYNAGQHANYSICPKGWRLPGGYGDAVYGNEFYPLFNTMGLGMTINTSGSTYWSSAESQLEIVQESPYNFAFIGYVNGEEYVSASRFEIGGWWSSTVHGSSTAYNLTIYPQRFLPGTSNDNVQRNYGHAVRCIAQ